MAERYEIRQSLLEYSTEGEPYMIRYNAEDSQVAVACSDGFVRVYSSETTALLSTLPCRRSIEAIPVTSLRWRRDHNILLATTADGGIYHWHVTSGQQVSQMIIEDNQVLSCDYNSDESKFAIGCRDFSVRIVDESTKSIEHTLLGGEGERLGHANRVFTVKWLNSNMLASAGWDNNVFIWDLREGKVVRYIHGPHICGDSLDSSQDKLLTGSYNTKDQLQVWNWENGANLYTETIDNERPLLLYAARYSKHDNAASLAIAGQGSGEIILYETQEMKRVGVLGNVAHSVYCLDFANTRSAFCVGTNDQKLKFYNISQ